MDAPMNEHNLLQILDDPMAYDDFDGFLDQKDFENVMNRILLASEKYLK